MTAIETLQVITGSAIILMIFGCLFVVMARDLGWRTALAVWVITAIVVTAGSAAVWLVFTGAGWEK